MISSKQSGLSSFMNDVIPGDSNWNTPAVFPSPIMLYTFLSSKSILSKSISIPRFSLIILTASLITVKVLKPRKSIFRSPSSSNVVISN